MNRHSRKLIALISFATLPLGTVACSNGSSPTEPAFSEEEALVSTSTSGTSLVTEESKGRGRGRGGDDNGGDNRGGRNGRGGKGGRGGGQDDTPRAGQEFEGAVASVGGNSLTLVNGTRIVVNGQTQWIARGDLHSLDQVAGSVAANRPTRVEGRGTRQADGGFLAATIKAEVDD
jgi:hypothetical protein